MPRVLIIDDEDDIREVASLSLEATAGWDIVTANSGRAGIEKALTDKPDAILMDVMMPEMDGPTTFRHLQENPATAHIPVVLLTAKVQGVDQRRFAGLGVAAVLFKPFDPLTLASQIAEALGWKLQGGMSASGNPMSGLLAGIWQRGLPQLMERLALLDRAAAAEPLAAELRLEATAVAHKLAGSLGMFGFREGTEFARELEVELERETVSRARVSELVKALRESLFPAE